MNKVYNGVLIRDFTETDIPLKVKWINNSENNQFLHYDLPLEEEKTLIWFRNKNNKKRVDCTIEYYGQPVGVIGLLDIDPINKKAEYYITVGSIEHKRKGIATISSNLLLEYAFSDLGLNKVYLNVDADNAIACRLYEHVGFVCEGEFKNDLVRNGEFINRKRYAILRSDWDKGWRNGKS